MGTRRRIDQINKQGTRNSAFISHLLIHKNMKHFKFPFLKCLEYVDLSRHISNHLIGENHTVRHRKIAGLSIMVAGVLLNEFIRSSVPIHSIHIIGDVTGYGLHGIGLMPFVKSIEKK